MKTLALNISNIPVAVLPTRKALLSVLSKRAVAIANYDESVTSSVYSSYDFILKKSHNSLISMPLPSVIQYTKSHYIPKKFTNILPFNRLNAYIRDQGICQYCGKKVSLSSFTFDHVIPRGLGGRSWWDNIVVSCLRCNGEKGMTPLGKYKRKLIREPYIPRLDKAAPAHVINAIMQEVPHKTWTDYVYWSVILEP